MYTLLNSPQNSQQTNAICADISDDSSLLAVGFSDSLIKIWPLTPGNLSGLKSASELENLDKESEDAFLRIMCKLNLDIKVFTGHSGPVYGLSFSPFKDLLLSCSEDSTSN